MLLWREWGARSKKNFAICPLSGFRELALGEPDGVREREDDGTRV